MSLRITIVLLIFLLAPAVALQPRPASAAAFYVVGPCVNSATRILIVRPDPGDTLLAGQRLLGVLDRINAPAPDNRWVIKLEPGTYDLGEATLNLPAYVDLEGSGLASSSVTSHAAITLSVDDESTVRQVTILNTNTDTSSCVQVANTARFESFAASLVNGPAIVLQVEAEAWLQDCAIEATSTTSSAWGVSLNQDATAHLVRCGLTIDGSGFAGTGIETADGGTLTADACDFQITNGTAVSASLTHTRMIDCTIDIDGASGNNTGVAASSGVLDLQDTTIVISEGAASTGVYLEAAESTLRQSVVDTPSGNSVVMGLPGTATVLGGEIGTVSLASETSIRLVGTRFTGGSTGEGETLCSGVTDASVVFYANTCP